MSSRFSGLVFAAICLAARVNAIFPLAGQTVVYATDVNNDKSCLTATANADGAAVVVGSCILGTGGTGALPATQQWVTTGGAQQAGQIRIFGDKCLDVTNGNTANGAKLQIWTCAAGNTNQQWVSSDWVTSHITWANNNKCVDLTDGDSTDGKQVQIWDCDAAGTNKNQNWSPLPFNEPATVQAALKANTNLCIAASSTTPGSPVVAATCNANSAAQTWQAAAASTNGYLSVFNSTLCLAPESTPIVAGTKLVAATCPTSKVAADRWALSLNTIRSALSGVDWCVDLTDGKQTSGNQLQVWNCVEGSTNQAWNFKFTFQ
ncbi:hypothetical protein MIND_00663700 [Mycena indigotica]|uniref:Ricin B lectin domain-containing protein n=1 Tax=Mycena indigotica TaxID=2126181 RepID=A0A8H6SJY6_9AGAR|nr:uncharacterized protein MIND_00663700 [Mycena indigotica]KAF7301003.1 hypothetical protein MIND_00663700 [Mycena indigotica]